ncbi:putative S-adenosylmethionine-dependent methyltransferase/MSMEI_2290 [Fundidesulfovibrio magnetotacticus]|uniref:Putative S-adenosylmethionine-dependent methyltransferase/MSMEI_2290 n=1 Tax=Fundidesulfovibrio magnetotacticus TaxID=2730080 RepID=A0A6V8LY24_9BACT|nr:class I SAM-dependent methyltransferase [Fundidesulfovibrio magnetotacticus]GFK95730.1 putative S-adenosylmethionine-dependent methyltransferase/MSMEI_2290 [Fundidesulfovibrio magnetotacticus]
MIWSNLEYVTLRLIRRFLFSGQALDRLGGWMPYWRVNQGRLDPSPIVDAYERLALRAGIATDGCRVVELGCGAANGTGHEWTARFGGSWTGVEPFALFDAALDATLQAQARARHPYGLSGNVGRVRDLALLPDAGADLIVSNSVLEHLRRPPEVFRHCFRVLAPGGAMLHRVDYRDHFFKYPFHFLTFSQSVWDNLLDPGDLPRHRLDDHLAALSRAGFEAHVLERETDHRALRAVAPFLAPPFDGRNPDMLATTTAVIACRKPH